MKGIIEFLVRVGVIRRKGVFYIGGSDVLPAPLKGQQEQEALEAEKERIRAERRAANPDGITANTSKKKLQQKQRSEEQAARAAAAKEYAARKGIVTEEESSEHCPSGVKDRPYCKGRAYKADRYGSKPTEE